MTDPAYLASRESGSTLNGRPGPPVWQRPTFAYTARVAALSAVLITLNEERRLGAALASVAFCDELLVVDAGSTDRTVEVAQEAGARVLVHTPWPGFVAQRNHAIAQARNDWILALDADEWVTPALRSEIEALAGRGFDAQGYRIPRVAYYLGRWIRHTDWYPDPQLRLFDRRRGHWQGGLVHESVQVDGRVGRLRGELEHYPYADVAEHVRTIDRYTSLWAQHAGSQGRHASLAALVGAPLWAFFRNYVLKGGVLLGGVGWTVSALGAYYTFLKLAKLRELERGSAPVAEDR
jgi:glycosyltransferase involved in cell wall biosynthesis